MDPVESWNASMEVRMRLYLSHRGMLLGYLNSLVGDPHLAEDLFQEVGLLVMKKGETVRSQGAFPAWLRSVARNKAMNALSKRKNKPLALDAAVLEALEPHWQDDSDRPALDALRVCIEKLSPKRRELLDYRYGRGIGGQQLASLLGRPVNTIYGTLSRTHRALGACVKQRLAQEGRADG